MQAAEAEDAASEAKAEDDVPVASDAGRQADKRGDKLSRLTLM